MEEGNSIIYGLEHQSRALSPQYGENDAIRFVIGTQSLTPEANQLHVVELEEDTGALHTKVWRHEVGEVWNVRCSPHDAAMLATTHNTYLPATVQCIMGVSLFRLPSTEVIPKDNEDLSALQSRNPESMELLKTISPEKPEEEVRCAEWHPTDRSRIGIVSESAIRVHDVETGEIISSSVPHGRAHLKFTLGKWSPHRAQCQFAALQDTHIKCYDVRANSVAWSVESAHAQLVRDLDFNPNQQFQLASVGDDGAMRIWDYRSAKEPIFARSDHSHWVWTVRYNTYHEQLILTGSSDARALLTAAASVCRTHDEGENPKELEDGVLQSYEQHEDSVYCCEWSSSEPWTFASLSFDGRLVISHVPRHAKYRLLL